MQTGGAGDCHGLTIPLEFGDRPQEIEGRIVFQDTVVAGIRHQDAAVRRGDQILSFLPGAGGCHCTVDGLFHRIAHRRRYGAIPFIIGIGRIGNIRQRRSCKADQQQGENDDLYQFSHFLASSG